MNQSKLKALDDSINIVDNLLNDLHTNPCYGASLSVNDNQDVHRLDTTQLAVMSMQFEVI